MTLPPLPPKLPPITNLPATSLPLPLPSTTTFTLPLPALSGGLSAVNRTSPQWIEAAWQLHIKNGGGWVQTAEIDELSRHVIMPLPRPKPKPLPLPGAL